MSRYDGPGDILHGGAFVDDHREGGEMWNFAPFGGRCYGYVMSHDFTGIDLNKVFPHPSGQPWKKGQALPGVTVVFTATREGHGRVIVGWYNNAVVYHKTYLPRPDGVRFATTDEEGSFVCETDAELAFLLAEEERDLKMPQGKGFPTQSQVWYGDPVNQEVEQYLEQVNGLIRPGAQQGIPAASRPTYTADPWLRTKIETSAVESVRSMLEARGYTLNSVERDKLGWDLDAVRGEERLRVEVKGHRGTDIHFELTPNEFAALKAYASSYRIGVVRDALSDTPSTVLFMPIEPMNDGSWSMLGESGEEITLQPRIGARGRTP